MVLRRGRFRHLLHSDSLERSLHDTNALFFLYRFLSLLMFLHVFGSTLQNSPPYRFDIYSVKEVLLSQISN